MVVPREDLAEEVAVGEVALETGDALGELELVVEPGEDDLAHKKGVNI